MGQTKIKSKQLQNTCMCRVHLSADQNDLTDSTYTKVNLDSEEFDVGGNLDISRWNPHTYLQVGRLV